MVIRLWYSLITLLVIIPYMIFLDCIVDIQYGPVRNWIYDVDGAISKKLM
jgi:hypothetical protein